MRSLVAALVLCGWSAASASAQGGQVGCAGASILVTTTTIVSTAAASTTEVVPASGNLVIYVCASELVSTAANTVAFASGDAGGACANAAALEGAKAYAANGGSARGDGHGVLLKVPKGKALCLTLSGATQVSGSVTWARF